MLLYLMIRLIFLRLCGIQEGRDGRQLPTPVYPLSSYVLECEPDMRPEGELRPTEPISVPGRLEMFVERPAPDAMRTTELERSVFRESGRDARKAIMPQLGALLDLVQTLASSGELLVALRVYSVVGAAFELNC